MASITLSEQEEKKRQYMLNGNELAVLFYIALPLVFYNSINQIFQFIDTLIASNIGSATVSIVAFIQQLHTMLGAIGQGLAIGGGIIIARHYGAGNMEKVSKNISTIFFAALFVGSVILLIFIPFAEPFLRLCNMPEELIEEGIAYFIIEIIALVSMFINTIYLSTEKAKGNTKRIFIYNMMVVTIKTTLNILLVYGLHLEDILVLASATLLAHSTLTIIALVKLLNKKNPFKISLKNTSFTKEYLLPLINLSLPIFLEKFVFSFGKVIVNSMSASYGSMVVGALGVSNRIGGLATNPPTGFQEAEATLISQNIGNNNTKRAINFFKMTILTNLVFSSIVFFIMITFKENLIALFAKGDPLFAQEIRSIYSYEMYASVLIALSASVMGLLYGFGYTKISMILNIVRLFIFRIPPLWIIQNFTNIGTEGVGIAMLISNGLIGITATIVAFILVRKIKNNNTPTT